MARRCSPSQASVIAGDSVFDPLPGVTRRWTGSIPGHTGSPRVGRPIAGELGLDLVKGAISVPSPRLPPISIGWSILIVRGAHRIRPRREVLAPVRLFNG